ncbi:hypothetical protein TNCV_840271 [Trichonephila clavipes]|nr:hypothetical protein TNCV_840271 [Trichonephila clavipes]
MNEAKRFKTNFRGCPRTTVEDNDSRGVCRVLCYSTPSIHIPLFYSNPTSKENSRAVGFSTFQLISSRIVMHSVAKYLFKCRTGEREKKKEGGWENERRKRKNKSRSLPLSKTLNKLKKEAKNPGPLVSGKDFGKA